MNIKKDVLLASFLAISIVLSLLESFLPIFNNIIPGLKLGLANSIILLILYFYSLKDALMISLLRVLLMAILRTGLFTPTFYFSLFGALFSVLVMAIARHTKLSMVGVSIMGAISHSIGQLFVAMFFLKTIGIWNYLPYLTIFSCITGTIIGVISIEIFKYLKKDCIFSSFIIK